MNLAELQMFYSVLKRKYFRNCFDSKDNNKELKLIVAVWGGKKGFKELETDISTLC